MIDPLDALREINALVDQMESDGVTLLRDTVTMSDARIAVGQVLLNWVEQFRPLLAGVVSPEMASPRHDAFETGG